MLDAISQSYLRMLNPIQSLNEDTLFEDRIDWLKQNTKSINTSHDTMAVHTEPHGIIDFMANHVDPTKKKVHTQHLIRMYNNGAFRQEDAPRVKETLSNFEKYKSKLPVEQRDLSKFNSIGSIQAAVEPHIGTGATKKESREILKDKLNIPDKHELKYDDDKISIYHLKDKETAQKLYAQRTAKNPGAYPTEWCTAWAPPRDRNQFDLYQRRGNMFVIHRKSDGAVFQYHPVDNQFMDKNDDTISKQDFESIKPSLHKAWDDAKHDLLDKKSRKVSEFLSKYAEKDRHYAFEDSPIVYLNPDNKNITSQQLHFALNENQPSTVRMKAIQHPNVNAEHIDKALNDSDSMVKMKAIQHPNVNTEHIDKALNDSVISVRSQAIAHPNATYKQINKALDDGVFYVRLSAIQNKKVTSKNIDKALNDSNEDVRSYALDHSKVTPEHISKALDDSSSIVRVQAIQHRKATSENIDKALNSSDTSVRHYAIQHRNATLENINKALNDSNADIRAKAKTRLKEFVK